MEDKDRIPPRQQQKEGVKDRSKKLTVVVVVVVDVGELLERVTLFVWGGS
jgi:hypothetical protein